MRSANFNTHVKEDGKNTKVEVAERECAVFVFCFFHGSLLRLGLVGFFDLGEEDNEESHDEHAAGNEQGRSRVGHMSLGGIADESTHEDIHSHSGSTVEHATNLYHLVAFVAAAAQNVKHGIDNGVEHTHAEARNECTDEVN